MSTRVLILEDEPSIRRLCARALAPLRWQITEAESLADVLGMSDLDSYDLLITDIMLPDGNGLDAAAMFLRQKPSAPVVVITGSPTIGVEEQARALGVKRFIRKPFRLELLVRTAREAIMDQPSA